MLAARFFRRVFWLLLVMTTAGRVMASETAAAQPAAPVEGAVEATPAVVRSAPPPPDSAAFATAIKAERRMLRAGDVEFPVFIHASTGRPARGVALLIPGDGQHPTTAPGIEQLRLSMPEHGWAVWVVALDPPPRVHAVQIRNQVATPDPATDPVDSPKNADPKAAQTTPPAVPTAAAEDASKAPAAAASGKASLQHQQAEELQQWAEGSLLRIATAVQAAKSDGGTVAVAEASAVALLRGYLSAGNAQQLLLAAITIEPVELPGLGADWPQDLNTPVLELLTPALRAQHGQALRQTAKARGLRQYRQAVVSLGDHAVGGAETALAHTVRGWLSSLAKPVAATPASD